MIVPDVCYCLTLALDECVAYRWLTMACSKRTLPVRSCNRLVKGVPSTFHTLSLLDCPAFGWLQEDATIIFSLERGLEKVAIIQDDWELIFRRSPVKRKCTISTPLLSRFSLFLHLKHIYFALPY